MVSDIRELSFVSVQSIPEIPYFRHSIQLLENIDVGEINKKIGSFASQLKRQHNLAIIADIRQVGFFSPIHLSSTAAYKIIDIQAINLADKSYSNAFFQVCNYQLLEIFRKELKGTVDSYSKRIYSKEIKILESEKLRIEAQRYLTFNFNLDFRDYLLLSLDFANEYHSHDTLDKIGLENLQIGDRLLNSYDGKSCEFLGIGTETISTPLNDLGRKSLIDYHQQKGNFLPTNIDPQTPLIRVRYNSNLGKPFDAVHIPQLLKKFFDRSNLDHQEWENQLLSISQKVIYASKIIDVINHNNRFQLSNQVIHFSSELRKPKPLIYLLNNHKNLDFGRECFSYPSQGLKKGYLFQKPAEIKASILVPKSLENITQKYLEELKREFQRFDINFRRLFYFYDPNDSLEINNCCKNLKECDIVIAIIPDSKEDEYDQDNNPYKRIKKQLILRRIPSQMITYKTIKKGWNPFIGYNLILGINGKLGFISWKLKELRGQTQAFLGLDIGRKNGKAVGASAFLFNGEGQLLGWSNTELQAHRENFDRETLHNTILELFSFYQKTYQQPLQHLVIHRDGELGNEEYDLLIKVSADLRKHGLINLDVIEVIKYQTCRAVEVRHLQENQNSVVYDKPDKGYIWEYCPNEALILTTGKYEAKVSNNSSPRPLRIRKRMGETDLILLAEQVYWLSEMQIGSMQTIRLPITTYYADRAAEYALEGLLPLGLQHEHHLWFL